MRLTSLVKTSGCAAKLNPTALEKTLKKLNPFIDERLLVGFENNDDALVYKIDEENVLVQSVDFFPPMVDDPYTFGQIAAANSISDIYAMGATPSIAMNIACFPSCVNLDILRQILQGGIDKAKEANVIIAGGHTIEDSVPKYGLCVSGFAKKNEILTNSTSKEGDVIVLTKPLGVGIINTASKVGLADEESKNIAISSMIQLNKYAKENLKDLKVNSLTDVTGFSLAGHCYEMAKAASMCIEIYSNNLPIIPGSTKLASMGIIPEGTYNNKEYLEGHYLNISNIQDPLLDIIFDPQTSGGLLISMPEMDAQKYLRRANDFTQYARIVGKVIKKDKYSLLIR